MRSKPFNFECYTVYQHRKNYGNLSNDRSSYNILQVVRREFGVGVGVGWGGASSGCHVGP